MKALKNSVMNHWFEPVHEFKKNVASDLDISENNITVNKNHVFIKLNNSVSEIPVEFVVGENV